MKAILTGALFLIATVPTFAQKQNTYYVKNDGRYVTNRDSADYVRIIQEPDTGANLYNVFDLYKDGAKRLVGKSSKVLPVSFEGQVAQFYPTGKKMQVANYHHNNLSGLFYQYYPSGKIFSVIQFRERTDGVKGDYYITSCLDTAGRELVKDGNGHYKGLDGGGDGIVEEGDVKEGVRDGDWKGIVAQIGVSFNEHYEQGKLISGTSTDKLGNTYSYTERHTRPDFRGGKKALNKVLGNQLNFLARDMAINVRGTAIISFSIDAKNKITDLKVTNTSNKDMEEILEKSVLISAKGWIPATLFGVPHKEHISFPFSLQTEDSSMFY
jgi:antitoxin component YwqK of YwqJK toxin-antitoxin module